MATLISKARERRRVERNGDLTNEKARLAEVHRIK